MEKQKINLIKVESSNIAAIGFENNILFIMFSNGGLYSYDNVENELFENMKKTKSAGKFFFANIKNNKNYKFKQLDVKNYNIIFQN